MNGLHQEFLESRAGGRKLEPFLHSYLGNLAQRRAEAGPRAYSTWGLKGKNPHRFLAMGKAGERRREMEEGGQPGRALPQGTPVP